jgi:FkbM family methyltransferase
MAEQHTALGEYSELLKETEVAAIEIAEDGVWMRSRLAPVWIACDPTDRGNPPIVSLNFGAYEQREFALWRSLLPQAARIADIGANIGWYTLHAAAIDPAATVVAFEPVPASFEFLRRAVARNALASVVVENVAVADHEDGLTLIADLTIAGAASAHPTIVLDHPREIRVPSVTLDGYAEAKGLHFDAIKLDVEGGELAVLRGAASILATDRPLVFCEMLRRHTRAFGYHPNDIIALMAVHGYRCFTHADGALWSFAEMAETTIETNFFFLHTESHAAQIGTAQG